MKNLLRLAVLAITFLWHAGIYGQCTYPSLLTVQNPSFEGQPQSHVTPSPWGNCLQNQTPDTQPGSWGVTLPATNGSSYLGLVHEASSGWQEGASQLLSSPMQAGVVYAFDIDLANSSSTDGGLVPGCIEAQIWGGNSACDQAQLLWSSGNVTPFDTWQTFHVSFTPLFNWSYINIVSHSLGCSADPYLLVDNMGPISAGAVGVATEMNNEESCGSGHNGMATAHVTGQSSSFTYLWSSVPAQTDSVLDNVAAGTYTVTVTNATGCTGSASVIITESTRKSAVTATTLADCGVCNGTATISMIDGLAPYTYVWSNWSTASVLQNACAGFYSTTVTDADLCSATATIFIGNDTTGSFSASLSSTGFSCVTPLDTVTLSINSTSVFNVSWGDGSSQIGLSPVQHVYSQQGHYSIYITDTTTHCIQQYSHHLSADTIHITLTASVPPTCALPNSGSIVVTATGGEAPYSYIWSNSTASDSILNISAGTYSVTATDNNQCQQQANFTLHMQNPLVVYGYCSQVAGCNSGSGSAAVLATGGTAPYSYSWNTVPVQTTSTASGLSAATYAYTVTDSAGCAVSGSVVVNSSYSFYVYSNLTSPNCGSNGAVSVTPNNGHPPYRYLWSTSPADTTSGISGLPAGVYTVTITDNAGCYKVVTNELFYKCTNIITGIITDDANGNCQRDGHEVNYSTGVYAVSANGDVYYGYAPTNTGVYQIEVPAGTYTVTPYLNSACVVLCDSVVHTFLSGGDTLYNANLFLQRPDFDLTASMALWGFRPGFYRTVNLNYHNAGTIPADGVLNFKYDSAVVVVGTSPGATLDTVAHTISWVHNGIAPNIYNKDTVQFYVPVNTPVSTLLSFVLEIAGPANECDTTNNSSYDMVWVTNSYDPNSKEVSPHDYLADSDSVLTYTINFQNTGNDTAFFVVIHDTLSSFLDAATVQNIESSHPFSEFDVKANGELVWVFNPIYLVDSTTNPEGSQGYIIFKVKKKHDVPLYAEINNTAWLYYDYNAPMQTNTASITYGVPLSVVNNTDTKSISAFAYPNPFNNSTTVKVEGLTQNFDMHLYNTTGQLVRQAFDITNNTFEIQRGDLAAGIYICKIHVDSKQTLVLRLSVY